MIRNLQKNNSMENLLKNIEELGVIRKGVPQFFYYNPINFFGTFHVRQAINDFKNKYKDNPCVEVDFIINSPGGSADDAYRIIRTLRKNFDKVNIIVPFWAKSAATLLSLGGSTIIMDDFGEFGALDVQLPKEKDDSPYFDEAESALIDEISLETIEGRSHKYFKNMFVSIYQDQLVPIPKNDIANDILNYLSKFYEPILKQINPYKIGDKKRKLDIGAQYAHRILIQYNKQVSKTERRRFIDYLVNECPDHGYIVDYDLIKEALPSILLYKSTEIDHEFPGYSNKLKDISVYLLSANHQTENYIGFVMPKEDEKADITKVEQSLNSEIKAKVKVKVKAKAKKQPTNSKSNKSLKINQTSNGQSNNQRSSSNSGKSEQ